MSFELFSLVLLLNICNTSVDCGSRPAPELQLAHLTGLYCAGGSANRPRHLVLDAKTDDRLIHTRKCVAGQGTQIDSPQAESSFDDVAGQMEVYCLQTAPSLVVQRGEVSAFDIS